MAREKPEKLSRLAEAVMRLVAQSGTDGLSIARLARSAGVSRSWIYKYGGTQDELVAFATDHFGHLFTSFETSDELGATLEEWLTMTAANFSKLLVLAESQPLVVTLYFRFRGTKSLLGQRIQRVEELQAAREIAQLSKLARIDGAAAGRAAELIGSARMGLAHAWIFGELKAVCSSEQARSAFQAAAAAIIESTKTGP